jgi:rubrerythrin
MFSLGEIVDLAVQIERNGERSYRKAQKEVSNQELASILEWLANDEREHEKWFLEMRKEIDEKTEDPKLEEMGREILNSVLGEQAFSMDDADFSRIKDIETLFYISLEFEKDTILFYEMIKDFIDDGKVLTGIDRIIKEEKKHVKRLEELTNKSETL